MVFQRWNPYLYWLVLSCPSSTLFPTHVFRPLGRGVHLKMETVKKSCFSLFIHFHGKTKIQDNKQFQSNSNKRSNVSLKQANLSSKLKVILATMRWCYHAFPKTRGMIMNGASYLLTQSPETKKLLLEGANFYIIFGDPVAKFLFRLAHRNRTTNLWGFLGHLMPVIRNRSRVRMLADCFQQTGT